MAEAFQKCGYRVRSAASAEEAEEILKQESIMVVFFDLNLPGVSGVEMCRKLRKDNPIGLYFAITGNIDLFSLLECRAAGFDDFFLKPIRLKAIIEAAEHAFRQLDRWKIFEFDLV